MATYVNDLRLKEIGTGESSGTWGTETNTNLELIGEALGFGTEAITTNADTHTTTVADGSTDPGRAMYLKYTGTLDSACTITIAPNTISRMHFIENGTSGSQNIIISQGTGANVTIPAGDVKAVYLDGAGSGAAVADAFASLNVVDLKVEDDLTVTDDLIVNGDIDLAGSIDVDGTANLDVVDIDGALTQDGGAVFNEDSADVDFRVESNGQTHALFVNGGLDNVGIGYSAEHTATNKGLVILTGDGNGGIQLNKEDGSNPSSGETLGSIAWKGSDSANNNAAAGASIVGIAAENFSGSAEGTHLAFNTKPTGTGPGSAPTENMRLDSAGNLDLVQTNHLRWKHQAGGTIRASIDADSSDNLMFYTGSSETERVRIDGSGRLLIGADSGDAFNDDAMLRLQRTGDRVFQSFKVDADQEAAIFFGDVDDDVECGIQYQASNKNLILSTGNNSEAMRIDSSGNVGIGETSPLGILHVKDGESSAPTPNESANTLVLEEDDNCGLSIFSGNNDNGMIAFGDAQDSDRGNILYDHNADSLSFTVAAATTMVLSSAQLVSMTHVASAHTGGLTLINSQAGGFGSALTFESERSDNNVLVDAARIRSEGANSWNSDSTTESALIFETCNNNSLSEAMRIRNDGTVVINTTTNQGVGGLTFGVGSNGITATNNTTTGAGNGHEFYVFRRNSTQIGSIVMSNTDGTTYSTSSDARLKNVLGEAKGLEIVNKLNPVNFEWKESKNVQDGLIAQEVQELIPHAVAVSEEGHYSMDYSQVVTPLIKAIQEQQEQIDALQSEINKLKGE